MANELEARRGVIDLCLVLVAGGGIAGIADARGPACRRTLERARDDVSEDAGEGTAVRRGSISLQAVEDRVAVDHGAVHGALAVHVQCAASLTV